MSERLVVAGGTRLRGDAPAVRAAPTKFVKHGVDDLTIARARQWAAERHAEKIEARRAARERDELRAAEDERERRERLAEDGRAWNAAQGRDVAS